MQLVFDVAGLLAAVDDSSVHHILLAPGTYAFDAAHCESSALCIRRGLVLEARWGTATLDAGGTLRANRRVVMIQVPLDEQLPLPQVKLVGLGIVRLWGSKPRPHPALAWMRDGSELMAMGSVAQMADQLHTSQAGDDSPVATWHQGGPGGSSIDVGLYTEMGYFQLSDEGPYVNEYAWNKVAHMLYLESPAGSGQSSGFSSCMKGGAQVPCRWDDVSQAEAYSHSLAAFFKAFPEYAKNELYLTGESYFGQCMPLFDRSARARLFDGLAR